VVAVCASVEVALAAATITAAVAPARLAALRMAERSANMETPRSGAGEIAATSDRVLPMWRHNIRDCLKFCP
jgi:hypothetical protein